MRAPILLLVPTLEHRLERRLGIRRAASAMPGATHGPETPEEETPTLVGSGAD